MQEQYKNICFYSSFGTGDLHNSREIIKNIIKNNPSNYFYAHPQDPKILSDIENLKHSKIYPFMNSMIPFIKGEENDLYINTWIGRDSKFVLPGIGCTLENYLKMFNEILSKVNLQKLDRSLEDYIPSINYSKFDIFRINEFIKDHKNLILISNGIVNSEQSINFDFTNIIMKLLDLFPEYDFILTQKINLDTKNLFFTDEIIQTTNSDLNEISYLSLFSKVIIGRSSGPYVFCQVKENYSDPIKKFLSFTKHINASDLIFSGLRKKFWSNATNENDILNKIIGVINE